MFDLHVDGYDRWIPLRLDLDPAEYADLLVREWPTTPRIGLVADGLAGLVRNLLAGKAELEPDGVVLLAAWVLSDSAEQLHPAVLATLRALPQAHTGTVASEVSAALYEEVQLYGTPVLRSVDTKSGPAWHTHFRLVVDVEGEREVHEQDTVFWLRPEQGCTVMLTAYSDNLLASRDVGDYLDVLAGGVSGL